jgi:hypothetical protein
MKNSQRLIILCVLVFPTIAFAGNARTKVEPVQRTQTVLPPANPRPAGFILRQDLFDRNNPNNLRSDWPGPPAQPGQF